MGERGSLEEDFARLGAAMRECQVAVAEQFERLARVLTRKKEAPAVHSEVNDGG